MGVARKNWEVVSALSDAQARIGRQFEEPPARVIAPDFAPYFDEESVRTPAADGALSAVIKLRRLRDGDFRARAWFLYHRGFLSFAGAASSAVRVPSSGKSSAVGMSRVSKINFAGSIPVFASDITKVFIMVEETARKLTSSNSNSHSALPGIGDQMQGFCDFPRDGRMVSSDSFMRAIM